MSIPNNSNRDIMHIGDIVRIVGIPDMFNWSEEQKEFSLYVFEYLVGKYKQIAGFNEYGMAEIEFRMKKDDVWEYHSVWLEPNCLRLKKSRGSS